MLWHRDSAIPNDIDAVILPGGFSYGDYLRCGAIAKFSPLIGAVKAFAAAHGIPLVATIPFDDAVRLADLAGTPFVDAQPNAAASELDRLAGLLANN